MTIHARVNYGRVASMVLRITAMNGGRLRLREVVKIVCTQLGLGLDTAAVKTALGSHCQTVVYDRGDVRVVEDWVIYG